jgi:hypothetical protein
MMAYLKAQRKDNVVFVSKRGLFCLEPPSKMEENQNIKSFGVGWGGSYL